MLPLNAARLSGHEEEDPDYEELEAVLHSQRKVGNLLSCVLVWSVGDRVGIFICLSLSGLLHFPSPFSPLYPTNSSVYWSLRQQLFTFFKIQPLHSTHFNILHIVWGH